MTKHTIPQQWHMGERVYDAYKIDDLVTSKTHWHSHFLVSLYTSGEGIQVINGIGYEIRKGCITVLSPLDFHRNIINEEKQASVCAVKFSANIFHQKLGNCCTLADFPIVQMLSDEDYETARTIFTLLLKEQKKEAVRGSGLFAETLIEQLVILALITEDGESKNVSSKVIRDALIYTHYNFKKDIKIEDVAKYVGYSANYFSTQFKKETGISFRRYLCDLRLEFAKNLLRYSDLSITEISLESGYNTIAHFSKMFKQKYGEAPEQCRRKGDY